MKKSTSMFLPTKGEISQRFYGRDSDLTRTDVDKSNISSEQDMLLNDTNMFLDKTKIISEDVYNMLISASRHYSADFKFNKAMMLRMYLDAYDDLENEKDNIPAGSLILARKEWDKLGYRVIANCRLMCHMTANCVISGDIIVYRGLKDRRKDGVASLKGEKKNLMAMHLVRENENKLKKLLKEPYLFYRVVNRGYAFENELLNDDDDQEVEKLVSGIVEANASLDFQSRDMQQLLENVGDEHRLETFMSTSLNINQAKLFMGEGCCLLEITIPAGTNGFYLSAHSNYQGEDSEYEVVLPPCTHLIVTGRKNGVTSVRCAGISDVARKRMTLDTTRLFMYETFLSTVKKYERMERGLKEMKKNYVDANYILNQPTSFMKLCNKLDNWEMPNLEVGDIGTYSNSKLTDTWTSKDKLNAEKLLKVKVNSSFLD